MNMRWLFGFVSALVLTLGVFGCGNTARPKADAAAKHVGSEHAHDAWWCDEHGVPEEICAQCNSKLAAEFQKTGDWCKKHDRPDSQCFVCHPELQQKFAARYEAKYGRQPPKLQADEAVETGTSKS